MTFSTDQPIALCWLRRDLRLDDNAALYHALKSGHPVLAVFIFDRIILDPLSDRHDRRVAFIHQQIHALQDQLTQLGSTLLVYYGEPLPIWKQIMQAMPLAGVYTNADYETYAKERDQQVQQLLAEQGIGFHAYKDQTIFDTDEVLTDAKKPYSVFGAYQRKWKANLTDFYVRSYPTQNYFNSFYKTAAQAIPSLASMKFKPVNESFPATQVSDQLLEHYAKNRDKPALEGTTQLSIHLRFGTISIRQLVRQAQAHSERFLTELIWRDFYFQILDHFPHVEHKPFRPNYEAVPWLNREEDIERWQQGMTGYPLVDAGMRQLNQVGWMHNRARLNAASFCIKHLLIDWRIGEAYFAQKLRDYDLAANNGNWQWVAGSGNDASPFFRVFNPVSQAKTFDPKEAYIREWIPEYGTPDYPKPMIEHTFARQRAIDTYRKALNRT
ncbi:DNA photolyase family protein [Spirosoma sp. RP8]|uniref:DNA photolyase family protein n=1 Tax=Spirosoma liriopis TaxID=2937440 RepID=A0ABT0HE28_9BACT|nr:deoxyribodipyrimidine photo-lyase [Spirosoma liriopis]MCK8490414.1 DNA photolyase family protein [Spirosoma liriopis]